MTFQVNFRPFFLLPPGPEPSLIQDSRANSKRCPQEFASFSNSCPIKAPKNSPFEAFSHCKICFALRTNQEKAKSGLNARIESVRCAPGVTRQAEPWRESLWGLEWGQMCCHGCSPASSHSKYPLCFSLVAPARGEPIHLHLCRPGQMRNQAPPGTRSFCLALTCMCVHQGHSWTCGEP